MTVIAEPLAVTPDVELAEKAVLAAMLQSRRAAETVMEILPATDCFADGVHRAVYDAIRYVTENGEPHEHASVLKRLVAVEAGIWRTGQAGVILGDLVHHISPSYETHARTVLKAAIRRRGHLALVQAAQIIADPGFDPETGADMIRKLIDDALDAGSSGSGLVTAAELYTSTVERIDAGRAPGVVQLPWVDLRSLVPYLRPGQLVTIAARPSLGKALALDTPLPTPTGWTTMGNVQVSDQLLGLDGKPITVTAATDVMNDRPCYEVEFSDGTKIVADAEHQWKTTTRASRRQAAEHRSRYYWGADQVERVQRIAAEAAAEPDRLVTRRELVDEVGAEFSAVIQARIIKRVPSERQERTFRRRVDRLGTVKDYPFVVPVYSRQQLLKVLAEHVLIPVLAAQAHQHEPIVTTSEIAQSLHRMEGDYPRANHSVEVAAGLQLPQADLVIPPYVLGTWLGDGSSNGPMFTTADPEMVVNLEAEGMVVGHRGRLSYVIKLPVQATEDRICIGCGRSFTPRQAHVLTCGRRCGPSRGARAARIRSARPICPGCGRSTSGGAQCKDCRFAHGTVTARLRALGVLNNKHIPVGYLRSSEDQRRDLLAGLLDTDGTVHATGSVQFAVTSERLARDTRELIVSLGYRCGWSEKKVRGHTAASSIAYTITFTTADDVFRLSRKRTTHAERRPVRTLRVGTRSIVAARPVLSVPVKCVEVDAPDHLYLASRSMIPTHNSMLGQDLARHVAMRQQIPVILFTMEQDRDEVMDRLLAAESSVLLHQITNSRLDDAEWDRVAAASPRFADSKLVIDDTPQITLAHIRARLRGMARRDPAQVAIIDYLQLMDSAGGENRQQEVSRLVSGLKAIAREFRIPVVMLCQLNRGPESRHDKRPFLSDARESGAVENDSDVAILIHRPDYYEQESPRAGEADLIVDKNRNGPRATVTVGFQGHYGRFVDLAPVAWTPSAAIREDR